MIADTKKAKVVEQHKSQSFWEYIVYDRGHKEGKLSKKNFVLLMY